jgi:hypothetical protein
MTKGLVAFFSQKGSWGKKMGGRVVGRKRSHIEIHKPHHFSKSCAVCRRVCAHGSRYFGKDHAQVFSGISAFYQHTGLGSDAVCVTHATPKPTTRKMFCARFWRRTLLNYLATPHGYAQSTGSGSTWRIYRRCIRCGEGGTYPCTPRTAVPRP